MQDMEAVRGSWRGAESPARGHRQQRRGRRAPARWANGQRLVEVVLHGTGAVNALATTRLSELPGVRAAAAEDANAMAG